MRGGGEVRVAARERRSRDAKRGERGRQDRRRREREDRAPTFSCGFLAHRHSFLYVVD